MEERLMKKSFGVMVLMIALLLVLTGCNDDEVITTLGTEATTEIETTTEVETTTVSQEDEIKMPKEEKFLSEVTHDGMVLSDGEGSLNVGLVSATPLTDVFSSVFYQNGENEYVMMPMMSGAFMKDGEFKLRNGGAVDFIVDSEAKTVTLKIAESFKWHDGTPVTARDFAYAYEIIGHGDYTGPLFRNDFKNVVGMEAYHWGTMSKATKKALKKKGKAHKTPEGIEPADFISGIVIVDDKTLQISFKNFGVDMLWGAGVPLEPVPYEQLKEIKISDLEKSDEVRKNPLSCGPYYVSKVIAGEKIVFTANDYFWHGKAHIPTITLTLVSPDAVATSMQAGEYDLYTGLPTSQYLEVKDLPNYTLLGRTALAYNYLGYKMGKWDAAQSKNVYNPEAKMSNINLRRAIAYALDVNKVAKMHYNDLSYKATTIIPPAFKKLHAYDVPNIEYDIDLANQLLDEANYIDINQDGFRENPQGEKLVINVAHMSNNEKTEQVVSYYLEQWKKIGLDVKLTTDALIDFNNFYDLVMSDNEEVDVFFGAWGTGNYPECYGLYGERAYWNFSRFVDEDFEKVLMSLNSISAFDAEYREQSYHELQRQVNEKLPVYAMFYRYNLVAVNKRIKYYDYGYGGDDKAYWSWADIQLTEQETIK